MAGTLTGRRWAGVVRLQCGRRKRLLDKSFGMDGCCGGRISRPARGRFGVLLVLRIRVGWCRRSGRFAEMLRRLRKRPRLSGVRWRVDGPILRLAVAAGTCGVGIVTRYLLGHAWLIDKVWWEWL